MAHSQHSIASLRGRGATIRACHSPPRRVVPSASASHCSLSSRVFQEPAQRQLPQRLPLTGRRVRLGPCRYLLRVQLTQPSRVPSTPRLSLGRRHAEPGTQVFRWQFVGTTAVASPPSRVLAIPKPSGRSHLRCHLRLRVPARRSPPQWRCCSITAASCR